VDAIRKTPPAAEHDETLLDWFLSLTPTERLAELESRVEFFNLAHRDGDSELSPHSKFLRPTASNMSS
jgi:hypothetical protein